MKKLKPMQQLFIWIIALSVIVTARNTSAGPFMMVDSGQSLGSSDSWSVALGDVDADGDLDAVFAYWSQPNKVRLNDGAGNLTDSGQNLGSSDSIGVALGDVDADGDLDAFVANWGQPKQVC